jgi:hypothetical protein
MIDDNEVIWESRITYGMVKLGLGLNVDWQLIHLTTDLDSAVEATCSEYGVEF